MRAIFVTFITAFIITTTAVAEPTLRQQAILINNLISGVKVACSCEVEGASVVSWEAFPNVSEWRIRYAEGVTENQKALGETFKRSFDPSQNMERR